MSRRRGEFEHRTSIFEGAFRAWSHLGGLDPELLETCSADDVDPLTNPINDDPRLVSQKKSGELKSGDSFNPDGSHRREYPYEPLPRSGLSHPYVQAILSPWLGPDADNEAIQLGLTTLRTWWQHRRKGESGSAIAALGTEKMKGVVEGYTRHFFRLAHCLIVNDKEQPPRTLYGKMKELEKIRAKRLKKKSREDDAVSRENIALNGALRGLGGAGGNDDSTGFVTGIKDDLTDSSLTPLERLHAAQRRQLADSGLIQGLGPDISTTPVISIKGKFLPGKIDLPAVVDALNRQSKQLAHRGASVSSSSVEGKSNTAAPNAVVSSTSGGGSVSGSSISVAASDSVMGLSPPVAPQQYGDPNRTPVVFVSANGDIQIAMSVDGITCAHCVKIVETVLKGCNGNKSPIDGLLDAAADKALMSVLIKIDKASNAKRIAFEASRNLAMVGYTAKTKEMNVIGADADEKSTHNLGALSTAFDVVAITEKKNFFDWSLPCTCPDNGVMRNDCARHSQMDKNIFEAFNERERQITDYMAGCGMKYGMACTCGPACRCKNCPIHSNSSDNNSSEGVKGKQQQQQEASNNNPFRNSDAAHFHSEMNAIDSQEEMDEHTINLEQQMAFFGMEPPSANVPVATVPVPTGNSLHPAGPPHINGFSSAAQHHDSIFNSHMMGGRSPRNSMMGGRSPRNSSVQRNPSILSYGNGLRGMSITSETTFGRAMSGLSALSIDWENLDDFDVEVDNSAHINNATGGVGRTSNGSGYDPLMNGPRRSSVRRSYGGMNNNNNNTSSSGGAGGDQQSPQEGTHVSFKV